MDMTVSNIFLSQNDNLNKCDNVKSSTDY